MESQKAIRLICLTLLVEIIFAMEHKMNIVISERTIDGKYI